MSGSGFRGRGFGPRGIRPNGPIGGPRFPHPNFNQQRRGDRHSNSDSWPVRPPWRLNRPGSFSPNFPRHPPFRGNGPYRGRGQPNLRGPHGGIRMPPPMGPRFQGPRVPGAVNSREMHDRYGNTKNQFEPPQPPLLGSEEERQQKISETADKLKQKLSSITQADTINFWDDEYVISNDDSAEKSQIADKGTQELRHEPPELNLTFSDPKDTGRVNLENATTHGLQPSTQHDPVQGENEVSDAVFEKEGPRDVEEVHTPSFDDNNQSVHECASTEEEQYHQENVITDMQFDPCPNDNAGFNASTDQQGARHTEGDTHEQNFQFSVNESEASGEPSGGDPRQVLRDDQADLNSAENEQTNEQTEGPGSNENTIPAYEQTHDPKAERDTNTEMHWTPRPEFNAPPESHYENTTDFQPECQNFNFNVRPELRPRFAYRPDFRPPRFPPRMMGPRHHWGFPQNDMGQGPRPQLRMPMHGGNRMPCPRYVQPSNQPEMEPQFGGFDPNAPPPRRNMPPGGQEQHCPRPPFFNPNQMPPAFNARAPPPQMGHIPSNDESQPGVVFNSRDELSNMNNPSKASEESLQVPPPPFDCRAPPPSIVPFTEGIRNAPAKEKLPNLPKFNPRKPPPTILPKEEILQPPPAFDPRPIPTESAPLLPPPTFSQISANMLSSTVANPAPIAEFSLPSTFSPIPAMHLTQPPGFVPALQLNYTSVLPPHSAVVQQAMPHVPQILSSPAQTHPLPLAPSVPMTQIQPSPPALPPPPPPPPNEPPEEHSMLPSEQTSVLNPEDEPESGLMEKALEWAAMNMNLNDNNVPSHESREVKDVPLPPFASMASTSSEKSRTKEHKSRKVKHDSPFGPPTNPEAAQDVTASDENPIEEMEEVPLSDDQYRPKVVFNLNSKTKVINKVEDWKDMLNENVLSILDKLNTPSATSAALETIVQHPTVEPAIAVDRVQRSEEKLCTTSPSKDDKRRKERTRLRTRPVTISPSPKTPGSDKPDKIDSVNSQPRSLSPPRNSDRRSTRSALPSNPEDDRKRSTLPRVCERRSTRNSLLTNSEDTRKSQPSSRDSDRRTSRSTPTMASQGGRAIPKPSRSSDRKSTRNTLPANTEDVSQAVTLTPPLLNLPRTSISTRESARKNRIIERFLKMSKNDLRNLVNDSTLHKFDGVMEHLIEEQGHTLSQEVRNAENQKMKHYGHEEFLNQITVMLNASETVDASNLPVEFINHLSQVFVNMDTSSASAANTASQGDAFEVNNAEIHEDDAQIFRNVAENFDTLVDSNAITNCDNEAADMWMSKERNDTDVAKKRKRHRKVSLSVPEVASLSTEVPVKPDVNNTASEKPITVVQQEPVVSLNMADLDDIFSAGIAKAKQQVAKHQPQPEEIVEKATADLDAIFSVGIAKARSASSKAGKLDSIDRHRHIGKALMESSHESRLDKTEKWNVRKEREDLDLYRNLTKEEWEAKHRTPRGSSTESLTRLRMTGSDSRDASQSREDPRGDDLKLSLSRVKSNYPAQRVHSSSPLRHRNASPQSFEIIENLSGPYKAAESSDSESSDSSSSSASSTKNATPNVKLLKVIKEREKIAKNRSLNETIRDEVTAEIERKWREKEKRKERKAHKKEKKRRGRIKRKKTKRKRSSGKDEVESSEEVSAEPVRLLTVDEIKKEVIVKIEPGLEVETVTSTTGGSIFAPGGTWSPASSSTTSSRSRDPTVELGKQQIPSLVSKSGNTAQTKLTDKTTIQNKTQQLKTKAQLKQMPEELMKITPNEVLSNKSMTIAPSFDILDAPFIASENNPAKSSVTSASATNSSKIGNDDKLTASPVVEDISRGNPAALPLPTTGNTSTKSTTKKAEEQVEKKRVVLSRTKQQEASKERKASVESVALNTSESSLTNKTYTETVAAKPVGPPQVNEAKKLPSSDSEKNATSSKSSSNPPVLLKRKPDSSRVSIQRKAVRAEKNPVTRRGLEAVSDTSSMEKPPKESNAVEIPASQSAIIPKHSNTKRSTRLTEKKSTDTKQEEKIENLPQGSTVPSTVSSDSEKTLTKSDIRQSKVDGNRVQLKRKQTAKKPSDDVQKQTLQIDENKPHDQLPEQRLLEEPKSAKSKQAPQRRTSSSKKETKETTEKELEAASATLQTISDINENTAVTLSPDNSQDNFDTFKNIRSEGSKELKLMKTGRERKRSKGRLSRNESLTTTIGDDDPPTRRESLDTSEPDDAPFSKPDETERKVRVVFKPGYECIARSSTETSLDSEDTNPERQDALSASRLEREKGDFDDLQMVLQQLEDSVDHQEQFEDAESKTSIVNKTQLEEISHESPNAPEMDPIETELEFNMKFESMLGIEKKQLWSNVESKSTTAPMIDTSNNEISTDSEKVNAVKKESETTLGQTDFVEEENFTEIKKTDVKIDQQSADQCFTQEGGAKEYLSTTEDADNMYNEDFIQIDETESEKAEYFGETEQVYSVRRKDLTGFRKPSDVVIKECTVELERVDIAVNQYFVETEGASTLDNEDLVDAGESSAETDAAANKECLTATEKEDAASKEYFNEMEKAEAAASNEFLMQSEKMNALDYKRLPEAEEASGEIDDRSSAAEEMAVLNKENLMKLAEMNTTRRENLTEMENEHILEIESFLNTEKSDTVANDCFMDAENRGTANDYEQLVELQQSDFQDNENMPEMETTDVDYNEPFLGMEDADTADSMRFLGMEDADAANAENYLGMEITVTSSNEHFLEMESGDIANHQNFINADKVDNRYTNTDPLETSSISAKELISDALPDTVPDEEITKFDVAREEEDTSKIEPTVSPDNSPFKGFSEKSVQLELLHQNEFQNLVLGELSKAAVKEENDSKNDNQDQDLKQSDQQDVTHSTELVANELESTRPLTPGFEDHEEENCPSKDNVDDIFNEEENVEPSTELDGRPEEVEILSNVTFSTRSPLIGNNFAQQEDTEKKMIQSPTVKNNETQEDREEVEESPREKKITETKDSSIEISKEATPENGEKSSSVVISETAEIVPVSEAAEIVPTPKSIEIISPSETAEIVSPSRTTKVVSSQKITQIIPLSETVKIDPLPESTKIALPSKATEIVPSLQIAKIDVPLEIVKTTQSPETIKVATLLETAEQNPSRDAKGGDNIDKLARNIPNVATDVLNRAINSFGDSHSVSSSLDFENGDFIVLSEISCDDEVSDEENDQSKIEQEIKIIEKEKNPVHTEKKTKVIDEEKNPILPQKETRVSEIEKNQTPIEKETKIASVQEHSVCIEKDVKTTDTEKYPAYINKEVKVIDLEENPIGLEKESRVNDVEETPVSGLESPYLENTTAVPKELLELSNPLDIPLLPSWDLSKVEEDPRISSEAHRSNPSSKTSESRSKDLTKSKKHKSSSERESRRKEKERDKKERTPKAPKIPESKETAMARMIEIDLEIQKLMSEKMTLYQMLTGGFLPTEESLMQSKNKPDGSTPGSDDTSSHRPRTPALVTQMIHNLEAVPMSSTQPIASTEPSVSKVTDQNCERIKSSKQRSQSKRASSQFKRTHPQYSSDDEEVSRYTEEKRTSSRKKRKGNDCKILRWENIIDSESSSAPTPETPADKSSASSAVKSILKRSGSKETFRGTSNKEPPKKHGNEEEQRERPRSVAKKKGHMALVSNDSPTTPIRPHSRSKRKIKEKTDGSNSSQPGKSAKESAALSEILPEKRHSKIEGTLKDPSEHKDKKLFTLSAKKFNSSVPLLKEDKSTKEKKPESNYSHKRPESTLMERLPIYSDESTMEPLDRDAAESKKPHRGLALLEETYKREIAISKKIKAEARKEKRKKESKDLADISEPLTLIDEELPLSVLYQKKCEEKRIRSEASHQISSQDKDPGESTGVRDHVIDVINAVAEDRIEDLYVDPAQVLPINATVSADIPGIISNDTVKQLLPSTSDEKGLHSQSSKGLHEVIESEMEKSATLVTAPNANVTLGTSLNILEVASETDLMSAYLNSPDTDEVSSGCHRDEILSKHAVIPNNNDIEDALEQLPSGDEFDQPEKNAMGDTENLLDDLIGVPECIELDKTEENEKTGHLEDIVRHDIMDKMSIDGVFNNLGPFETIDELQETCEIQSKEEIATQNQSSGDRVEESPTIIDLENDVALISPSNTEKVNDKLDSEINPLEDKSAEKRSVEEPPALRDNEQVLEPTTESSSSLQKDVEVTKLKGIEKDLAVLESIIEKVGDDIDEKPNSPETVMKPPMNSTTDVEQSPADPNVSTVTSVSEEVITLEDVEADAEVQEAFSHCARFVDDRADCYEEHSKTTGQSLRPIDRSSEQVSTADMKEADEAGSEKADAEYSTELPVSTMRDDDDDDDDDDDVEKEKVSGKRKRSRHRKVTSGRKSKISVKSPVEKRTRRRKRKSKKSSSEKTDANISGNKSPEEITESRELLSRAFSCSSRDEETENLPGNFRRRRVGRPQSIIARKRSTYTESDASSGDPLEVSKGHAESATLKEEANKRSRKRERPVTREEMMNCKVRLIDSKYTYLRPDVHPRVLQRFGISTINPYVPSDSAIIDSTTSLSQNPAPLSEVPKSDATTKTASRTVSIVEPSTSSHETSQPRQKRLSVQEKLDSKAIASSSSKVETKRLRSKSPARTVRDEATIAPRETVPDIVVMEERKVTRSMKIQGQDVQIGDAVAGGSQHASPIEELESARTQYTVHKGPVLDIKIFQDSFLAASEDGTIYRYSQMSNGILNLYKGHKSAVTCLYILKVGSSGVTHEWMFSGSLDGTLRCYDILTGAQKRDTVDVGSPVQCMDQAWGVIFLGTKSGHVSRFHIKSGTLKGDKIEFSKESLLALKATNEGSRRVLIVASRNQPITIRDAQTGLFLRTVSGYKSYTVYSLLMDSSLVYCGTSSTSIPVFDFITGEQTAQYNAGVGIVCMRLYHKLLFAGCYDGNIYVFDTKEKKLICNIPGPGNMLLSMEVVKNKIIAGSKDKRLHSWQMPWQVQALLNGKDR